MHRDQLSREDEVSRLRVPPHSIEAEQSLLGGLLLDNSAWDRVGDVLAERDFYRFEHRQIFGAAAALLTASKPADVITVHEQLQRMGKADECGGMSYLASLTASVPSAANARAYALIVRERALRRQMVVIGDELCTKAFGGDGDAPVDRIVDEAVTQLMTLTQTSANDEPQDIVQLLPAFVDRVQAAYDGKTDAIETGLADLDDILGGGLRPGELTVIGARPSMGKTATVLTLLRNIGRTHPALLMSLEDSWPALVARMVASAGSINLADLRRPDRAPDTMWAGLAEGVEQLGFLHIDIDDSAGLDTRALRRKIQQSRRRRGRPHGLIVVDYLQLVECDEEGNNRNQALGRVANGLKRWAKEYGSPIVLLSQLSRKADEVNGPPHMSHLRDSGDIEGAADNIFLLYREAQRNPTAENKYHMELHIPKQKNGPTGMVNLHFDGATQRIGNWSGPPPTKPGKTARKITNTGLS